MVEGLPHRAAAEFIGTFTLLFAGIGAIAVGADLTGVAFAHGLAIVVMVSAFRHISGSRSLPAPSRPRCS